MNGGTKEILMKGCESSKRPIDNYIDYYDEYQNHTQQVKKYLNYYLILALAATLLFHALKIMVNAHFTAYEWTYYLPFLLWLDVLARFRKSFSVYDPHVLNDRKEVIFCTVAVDLFNFYLICFFCVLLVFMAVHIFVGLTGKYLLLVDLLEFVLNTRVLLQVKNLEERLKNTVACLRSHKTYFLNDYIQQEMKEPFEQQFPQKDERYSLLHEKVNQFLSPVTIRTQKTMKLQRNNSLMSSIEEKQLYSN